MGNTPLQLAVSHGYSQTHLHTVQCILQHSAEQDSRPAALNPLLPALLENRDHGGNTALLSAAQWGNAALVNCMLRHGADPFAVREGADGSSALHWAMRRGDTRMAWGLLRAGGWPLLLVQTRAATDRGRCPSSIQTTAKPFAVGVEQGAEHSTATSCAGSHATAQLRQRIVATQDKQSEGTYVSDSDASSTSSAGHSVHAPPNSPAAGSVGSSTSWPWAEDEPRPHTHTGSQEPSQGEYGCSPIDAAVGAGFTPFAWTVRSWGQAALVFSARQLLTGASRHRNTNNSDYCAQAAGLASTPMLGQHMHSSHHNGHSWDHRQALLVLGALPADVALRVAELLI